MFIEVWDNIKGEDVTKLVEDFGYNDYDWAIDDYLFFNSGFVCDGIEPDDCNNSANRGFFTVNPVFQDVESSVPRSYACDMVDSV